MPTLQDIQAQIDSFRAKTPQLESYNNAPTGSDFAEQLRTRLTSGESVENIIKNVAQQRARLLAIPAETRAQMPIGVYSPTQTAGLIAAREEPVRTSYETLMGVKQAREGRMEDIIDRVQKGYEASIEKQKVKADQERQKMEDLIEERSWLVQQSQYSAEQAESKRRWEAQQAQQALQLAKPDIFGGAEGGYGKTYFDTQTGKWVTQMPSGGTKGTTNDTAFWSEIDTGRNELQQGETWGNVWNRIKQQFPNVSNSQIDNALGVSWKEPGAYQKFLSQKTSGEGDMTRLLQIQAKLSDPNISTEEAISLYAELNNM